MMKIISVITWTLALWFGNAEDIEIRTRMIEDINEMKIKEYFNYKSIIQYEKNLAYLQSQYLCTRRVTT